MSDRTTQLCSDEFTQSSSYTRITIPLTPQRRRHQRHRVASDEQEGHVSLRRLRKLLERLLVRLRARDHFLHVTEDHVQVLIVRLRAKPRRRVVSRRSSDRSFDSRSRRVDSRRRRTCKRPLASLSPRSLT